MRRQFNYFDFFLLGAVCLLVIFGIIMIGSATRAGSVDGSIGEMKKQIIWFALGLVLLIIASFIDYHFISRFYILIYIVCIGLLVGVLVYNHIRGESVARWYRFGSIKLQPSEFAKIFMIIFLATFLHKKQETINRLPTFILLITLTALPIALVMIQPSLSASLMLAFLCMAILFVGNVSIKYLLIGVAVVVPSILILYQDLLRKPFYVFSDKLFAGYQIDRLLSFFGLDQNKDLAYQQNISINAICSGQLSGKGLFNGPITQSGILPEQQTDFIFAVIAEELGFIGCVILLALVLFIIFKCVVAAQTASDLLGRLIATGVAGMLSFQVFSNVGVATGLLPNTGVPFPFVSYGGSSMWINMIAIGLVINVGMTKTKSIFEG